MLDYLIDSLILIIISRHPNKIVSGFLKVRNTFKLSMEEVFSLKLLPLLSVSFLLVALVTLDHHSFMIILNYEI